MRIRTPEYKEWVKEYNKKYREANPEVHRERVRISRKRAIAKDPDHYKKQDLKRAYGITLDWYNETLKNQNYCCAICFKHESQNTTRNGKPLKLSVDHCHDTGTIRGILCNNCNRAIGMLNHNPTILTSAIQYLSQVRGLT